MTMRFAYSAPMRRIVRRTATIVTVQTWTVTWAEEDPAAEPAPAVPAPDQLAGPAPAAEATLTEASDTPAQPAQPTDTPLNLENQP
jgi:hypothetical protein